MVVAVEHVACLAGVISFAKDCRLGSGEYSAGGASDFPDLDFIVALIPGVIIAGVVVFLFFDVDGSCIECILLVESDIAISVDGAFREEESPIVDGFAAYYIAVILHAGVSEIANSDGVAVLF